MTKASKSARVSEGGLADVMNRILHRVDMKESHEGDGSTAERWSNTAPSCPLTSAELSELSFLCQTLSNERVDCTMSASTTQERKPATGFASIESDSLLSLMELLERHVNLASSIHLVQEAAAVLANPANAAPSQAANAMDKVRVLSRKVLCRKECAQFTFLFTCPLCPCSG